MHGSRDQYPHKPEGTCTYTSQQTIMYRRIVLVGNGDKVKRWLPLSNFLCEKRN